MENILFPSLKLILLEFFVHESTPSRGFESCMKKGNSIKFFYEEVGWGSESFGFGSFKLREH